MRQSGRFRIGPGHEVGVTAEVFHSRFRLDAALDLINHDDGLHHEGGRPAHSHRNLLWDSKHLMDIRRPRVWPQHVVIKSYIRLSTLPPRRVSSFPEAALSGTTRRMSFQGPWTSGIVASALLTRDPAMPRPRGFS